MRGAARLLAETSTRSGVTLRAIAREVGIAAPSIYVYFPDRNAVLDAVVSATFENLYDECMTAAASAPDAPARLRAICNAYLDFASAHPGEYRILFERSPADTTGTRYGKGIETFHILVQAVEGHHTHGKFDAAETATSRGGEPQVDATREAQLVWAALHGLATLLPATPGFPWRSHEDLVEGIVGMI